MAYMAVRSDLAAAIAHCLRRTPDLICRNGKWIVYAIIASTNSLLAL